MSDTSMRIVRETFDTGRSLVRSADLVLKERGPINYLCGGCGTVLLRNAGSQLPDVIVICPECLELNEADLSPSSVGLPSEHWSGVG